MWGARCPRGRDRARSVTVARLQRQTSWRCVPLRRSYWRSGPQRAQVDLALGATGAIPRGADGLGFPGAAERAPGARDAHRDWRARDLRDDRRRIGRGLVRRLPPRTAWAPAPGSPARWASPPSATMTIGRALGDRLIQRFGVVPLIRAAARSPRWGLPSPWRLRSRSLAVAGFADLRRGPVRRRAAGVRGRWPGRPGPAPDPASRRSSGSATLAPCRPLPAVIGHLASRIGLHAALAVPVALALWIAVGASALPRPSTLLAPAVWGLAGHGRPNLQR